MAQSLEEIIYDKLYSVLVPENGILTFITTHYMFQTRKYALTNQMLMYVVDDIIHDHPKIAPYREAINALYRSEVNLPIKVSTPLNCPYNKYIEIRNRMVDLTNKDNIMQDLISLGQNPTMYLSSEKLINKYYRDSLVNKLWSTKWDNKEGNSVEHIRNRSIKAIMDNPKKSLEDKYVFAALADYSSYIVL